MNKGEAIRIIKNIDTEWIGTKKDREETEQAIDMAIEALAEPNMIPIKLEKRYPESRDEDITDAFMQGYLKGKADRPQGEWISNRSGWKCSECGIRVAIFGKGNYCLNCGADMRGDEE